MPKSKKRRLRRLERKYKAFNNRTLPAAIIIGIILLVGGLIFETDQASGQPSWKSPLLNLAFLWTGLFCIQIAGSFAIGTLRTQAENKYPELIWQLVWFLVFTSSGVMVIRFGMRGFMV